jgi:signal peptidase I
MPNDSSEPMPLNPKPFFHKLWRDWLVPVATVVVVFGSFRSVIADWNDVPTGSMEPTVLVGDRIFVNKLSYGLRIPFTQHWLTRWSGPQRGDIVVCFSPKDGTRLVKRVVGLPGDTLELRDNILHINGVPAGYVQVDPSTLGPTPADNTFHEYFAENLGPITHVMMDTPGIRAARTFEPLVIPPGRYFMMGDNRDNSFDSRFFGFIDQAQILGRSGRVIFSLDKQHAYLPRWGRFLHALR